MVASCAALLLPAAPATAAPLIDISRGLLSGFFTVQSYDGRVFTQLTAGSFHASCGVANVICLTAGSARAVYNGSGTTLDFGGVRISAGTFAMQPATVAGSGQSDIRLVFTPPTYATNPTVYDLTFEQLNTGNGSNIEVRLGDTTLQTDTVTLSARTPQIADYLWQLQTFSIQTANGAPLSLIVSRRGRDSVNWVSVSGQVQPVPEPSTWAMMIVGVGATGAMMRRRKLPAAA